MTNLTKQPKPKRRWLRFSLRSFLIALTIFCVWIGWYAYRAEQQREAVKWVRENGGKIYYDYELDESGFIDDGQVQELRMALPNCSIGWSPAGE